MRGGRARASPAWRGVWAHAPGSIMARVAKALGKGVAPHLALCGGSDEDARDRVVEGALLAIT